MAAVRHGETRYDDLLMSGVDRLNARSQVQDEVPACPPVLVNPLLSHFACVSAILALTSRAVPSIQVKDVPDDVHTTLRRRAAAAGQSLQEYLLALLVEEARSPTLDELLDRAGGRAGGRAGFEAAAQAVRADRDVR